MTYRSNVWICALMGVLLLPTLGLAQGVNVTLLSNTDGKPANDYNDCWGYVDELGNEYAIIGYTGGTLFYNVNDPANPVLVGDISGAGSNSTWRDMKTNGDYCYIGSEGSNSGIQIVDLTDPENPTDVGKYSSFTSHNVFMDTVTQRLYACGSSGDDLRIIDVGTNPTSLTQVGSWNLAYTHDLYVENDRAYTGNINNSEFRILDVTNPAAVGNLATLNYSQASHATWLLESNNDILLTADEQSDGIIRAWDISDLGNIQALGTYQSGSGTSVHNVFSIGSLVYASYYTEGLRIISFADPSNPVEVGSYDTFAGGGLYAGAWGCYPFLPSGTIIISDIQTGLWLFSFNAPGIVAGTVTDTSGTFPVPANVAIPSEPAADSTDAAGAYIVTATPGSQQVIVSAFGFVSDTSNVNLIAGQTATHDVSLTPLAGSSISGSVSGALAPIQDVTVRLLGGPRSDVTDVSGNYLLEYIPVGAHSVVASKFGFDSDTVQVNVQDGVPANANFTLVPWHLAIDMETAPSPAWTKGAAGDNATTGIWIRRNPNGTSGGTVAPEDDHTIDPGVQAWITGQGSPGEAIGISDVDGGKTTLLSAVYDLSSLDEPEIIYHRWFSNNAGSNPGVEPWVVHVSNDSGNTWATVESTHTTENFWKEVRFKVSDFVAPTTEVQVRFIARDNIGSIVEAGVDDFGIRGNQSATDVGGPATVPARPVLAQNRPNPFNPTTTIDFSIPQRGTVDLNVYEPSGRLVRTLVKGALDAGRHTVIWNGTDDAGRPVGSGVYLYRLRNGASRETKKLVLIR